MTDLKDNNAHKNLQDDYRTNVHFICLALSYNLGSYSM